jgi:hypothetical protein
MSESRILKILFRQKKNILWDFDNGRKKLRGSNDILRYWEQPKRVDKLR